jgi:hypothetical protein
MIRSTCVLPESKGIGKWIALVSGFDLSSADVPSGTEHSADIRLQMLIEYLKGESGGSEDQQASSEVKALVILGNSIDVPRRATDDSKNAVSVRLCLSETFDSRMRRMMGLKSSILCLLGLDVLGPRCLIRDLVLVLILDRSS